MTRYLCLALLVPAVLGCQGGGGAAQPAVTAPDPTAPTTQLQEPGTVDPSLIALWKNRDSVHVGSDPDKAFEVFRGDRPGGFLSDRTPEGLGPLFKAKVWQGAEIGFGVITFKGNLSVALYEDDAMTQDDLNNLVASYRDHLNSEPQLISGDRVNYWFWSEPFTKSGHVIGEQRLMIMAYASATSGDVFCAVAMGDGKVMDVLGASPSAAASEQVQVDNILGRRDNADNAAPRH